MQPSDRPDFKALLTEAMAFYRQDVTTFSLGVWWAACERFDMEQVRKAMTAHALDPDRGQFVPKPADIVRQLQGTSTDRSLMAWSKVMEAAQRVGAWRSVVFDDPAIHAAITDLGGWPTVCRGEIDELPFLQKRFCDAHRAYAQRPGFAYPPRLVGNHEEINGLTGHDSQPCMLVGDEAKARAVLAAGTAGPRTPMVSANAALRLGASARCRDDSDGAAVATRRQR